MIRFYTYLFACTYVSVESLHKKPHLRPFYVFAAWMTVTITVLLNLAALCFSIPAALGLPHVRVPSHANVGAPLVLVLACICWLLFVRNKKGVRLAEELNGRDEDSIPRCQLVYYGTLFGSIALFFIPLIVAAYFDSPTRASGGVDFGNAPTTQLRSR